MVTNINTDFTLKSSPGLSPQSHRDGGLDIQKEPPEEDLTFSGTDIKLAQVPPNIIDLLGWTHSNQMYRRLRYKPPLPSPLFTSPFEGTNVTLGQIEILGSALHGMCLWL